MAHRRGGARGNTPCVETSEPIAPGVEALFPHHFCGFSSAPRRVEAMAGRSKSAHVAPFPRENRAIRGTGAKKSAELACIGAFAIHVIEPAPAQISRDLTDRREGTCPSHLDEKPGSATIQDVGVMHHTPR